jgi:DNA-binding beta-propeller fold protein YncE
MKKAIAKLATLWGALALMGVLAAPAWGATSDPLFVFTPTPPAPPAPIVPPPVGYLNGPCGLAVDSSARFYVSDYYHHAVDVFSSNVSVAKPSDSYVAQLPNEDPLDGPCGLAFDATNNLYVNNFHRNVVKFNASPGFGTGTVIAGAPLDSSRPTGVAVNPSTGNVYVNDRTYVAVYDSSGAPVLDGGEPLKIGLGTLGDGYGLAVSQFPATLGRLYVPDAATNTVKVYDPAIDKVNPVATIDGSATPSAGFVSLRDSAVAVDRVSGDVYIADNTQPLYAERPQATIYVYSSLGAYKGHLKYNIVDALPPGLAVDNSTAPATQGRVYVTSGNTDKASVYVYRPGAATTAPPLAPTQSLALAATGSGAGQITSQVGGLDCSSTCQAQLPAGAQLSLTATPEAGSTFEGWSGTGCSGSGECTVRMEEATSLNARFDEEPSPSGSSAVPASPSFTQRPLAGHRHRPKHRRHPHRSHKRKSR